MSNESLYQKIQPIKISTTPFNISNFQFNTFECMSGSNIINLPNYVAPGTSFTIINLDTITKTIMNGTSVFAQLNSNQTIIVIADITSNSWVISSSTSNIIGSLFNSIDEPFTINSTPFTITTELLSQNNYFICMNGSNIINLPTSIKGYSFSIYNLTFNPIALPNLVPSILIPFQKIILFGRITGNWSTFDSIILNPLITPTALIGSSGVQTNNTVGATFPVSLFPGLTTINGGYNFNAILTINSSNLNENGTLVTPCFISTLTPTLPARINFLSQQAGNAAFQFGITATSNTNLIIKIYLSTTTETNWKIDIITTN